MASPPPLRGYGTACWRGEAGCGRRLHAGGDFGPPSPGRSLPTPSRRCHRRTTVHLHDYTTTHLEILQQRENLTAIPQRL